MKTSTASALEKKPRADIEVRWHPRATAIADGPRVSAGQRFHPSHGMGEASLSPVAVNYQGNGWTLAWSRTHKTLWVLTDDEYTVLQNHAELLDIAMIVAAAGGVSQQALDEAQAKQRLASLDKTRPQSTPRTRAEQAALAIAMNKDQALKLLAQAAAHAFVAGATLDEVRGAVYAAMGLDSDD